MADNKLHWKDNHYYRGSERCCGERSLDRWVCTEAADHHGDHIAQSEDPGPILYRWPNLKGAAMKVLRHDPPPAVLPPPTFDITGLNVNEAQMLMFVCEKSTYLAERLRVTFGSFPESHRVAVVLNELYHALRKAGVPDVKA